MALQARPLALGALALLSYALPAVRAQEVPSLLAADRAAAELAGRSGLAAVVRESFDARGVLLWPGAPVVGGAGEAARLLAAQRPLDSLSLTWQPLGLELARDSSLGVTWGDVAAGLPSGPPRLGRYIAAWRRDGTRWVIAALLVGGITPPEAATVPPAMPRRRPPLAPAGAAGPFVRADLAFARLAADSGAGLAFERWAAPEAVIRGGGGVLARGPRAIGETVAGPAAWRWHPVAAGASRTGDLGWTVGEAVITPEDGRPNYSKYLTVWTRRPDGTIRFLTDGGTPRPADR